MEANMKRSGYDGKGEDAGEGKGAGKGSKKGGGGGSAAATLSCIMKFLTPEVLASAIIGKGGAVIAAMRTSCNAKLALSEHGEFYPSTDCRVLTAQANEKESLTEVTKQLVAKVVELSKSSTTEDAGTEDELKIRTLVPRAAVGGIIGKGGAAIKALRDTTGAKVHISEAIGSGPGAEQTVSITGSASALEAALKEVNNQIQLLNGETWFQTWAGSTGASSGGYGALAGGGLGGHMGYGGRGGSMGSPGVDLMMRVAQTLPPYVMEDSRGFALSCTVPNRLVGGLIGRGGAGTKEVQMLTGTKIGIRDIPGDAESRSMNIAGPLANTCAAYMMMMKRYLDAEASAAASGPAQA